MFKAELFNPDEWAGIFRDAGARYVILTSKHHDAFTLWPSKYSPNWNSAEIGAKQNLLHNLTVAVRNKGMKMGYYYSLLEWFHPLYRYRSMDRYTVEHMIPQMKELITDYRPDLLWTDGEW